MGSDHLSASQPTGLRYANELTDVEWARWVAERLFAWIGRNRPLAKDVEATLARFSAFLCAASAPLLTHTAARP